METEILTHYEDGVYVELVGIQVERHEASPPQFPKCCPACGAEIAGGSGEVTSPWQEIQYGCGGKYKHKSQIQNHTYIWTGRCLQWQRADLLGLDRDTPKAILYDAEIDAKFRDDEGKPLSRHLKRSIS